MHGNCLQFWQTSDQQCSLFTGLDQLIISSQSGDRNIKSALDNAKLDLIDVIESQRRDLQLGFEQMWLETDRAHKTSLAKYDSALDAICSRLDILATHADEYDRSERILKSLNHPDIHARESRMKDADPDTFRWIFRKTVPFKSWLTAGKGVFLVCGKAGSGKSTLMRYIAESRHTRRLLKEWAGSNTLIVASFFFWNSGSMLQKSQQGLLQSLLFQLLKQCPQMIPYAAPDRWAAERASLSLPKPWTSTELSASIVRALQQQSAQTRFCFFIDGLDEFEGSPADLIQSLDGLQRSAFAKICVSSRPRTAFVEEYGQPQQLDQIQLQDHTGEDIRNFVRQRLCVDPKFVALAQSDRNALKLVDLIQRRSAGVFLWVVLVVQEVRDGVYERDTVSQIFERVALLPKTLEELFARTISGVHSIYRKQMARLLLVMVYAYEPLPVPAASFIEDEAVHAGTDTVECPSKLQPEEFKKRQETTKRNISKWCRDLVEICPNQTYASPELTSPGCSTWDLVDFSHRSVRDYLRLPEVESNLLALAGTGFDRLIASCRLWFCWLCVLDTPSALQKGHVYVWYLMSDVAAQVMALARVIELHKGSTPSGMLDKVDEICTSHFAQRHEQWRHWSGVMLRAAKPMWRTTNSSFLSYAASFGLEIYLRQRLETAQQSVLLTDGPYMLDSALREIYSRPLWCVEIAPHVGVAELLLSKGVSIDHTLNLDPTFERYTPVDELEVVSGRAQQYDEPNVVVFGPSDNTTIRTREARKRSGLAFVRSPSNERPGVTSQSPQLGILELDTVSVLSTDPDPMHAAKVNRYSELLSSDGRKSPDAYRSILGSSYSQPYRSEELPSTDELFPDDLLSLGDRATILDLYLHDLRAEFAPEDRAIELARVAQAAGAGMQSIMRRMLITCCSEASRPESVR
jgi:hypothetical protein